MAYETSMVIRSTRPLFFWWKHGDLNPDPQHAMLVSYQLDDAPKYLVPARGVAPRPLAFQASVQTTYTRPANKLEWL